MTTETSSFAISPVKVADNDEAGILIVQDRGPLTLLEGVDSNSGVLDDYLVSSYTVVLTRAPEETVRVAATQIDASAKLRRAGAEGIHLSTSSLPMASPTMERRSSSTAKTGSSRKPFT